MCYAILINNLSLYSAYPPLIKQLLSELQQYVSQANCLNTLRQANIPFLNLGNVVYCPEQKILLFFGQHQLYAYDFCN